MNKDVKKLLREAEKQGWRVKKTKKHYMLLAPNGYGQVLCPGSPSDWRSLRNTISEMRQHGFEWRR